MGVIQQQRATFGKAQANPKIFLIAQTGCPAKLGHN